jgi:hypothetical protein
MDLDACRDDYIGSSDGAFAALADVKSYWFIML